MFFSKYGLHCPDGKENEFFERTAAILLITDVGEGTWSLLSVWREKKKWFQFLSQSVSAGWWNLTNLLMVRCQSLQKRKWDKVVVTDFTPSDITDTTIVDPGEKQREQTMGSGQAQRLSQSGTSCCRFETHNTRLHKEHWSDPFLMQ